jgi:hypothetical protein
MRLEVATPPRSLCIPLQRIALCLDCDHCFELGQAKCPACESEAWIALARFLGRALDSLRRGARAQVAATRVPQPPALGRMPLFVVANRVVMESFAESENLLVVLDRRRGQRRRDPRPFEPERRRAERRMRPDFDDQLRLRGWFSVGRCALNGAAQ